MWSKNGRPVSAFAEPDPSSLSSTRTRVSRVARSTEASRRLAGAGRSALIAGSPGCSSQDLLQGLEEAIDLGPGSGRNAEAVRHDLAHVPDLHPPLEEPGPDLRRRLLRPEQDEVGLGGEGPHAHRAE